MNNVTLHLGDCLDVLREMEPGSVHCCVTSPPYFGLRDYGNEKQIGLEDSPESYVAKLVDVFREVRKVLRDDGTLWLNLGSSYNGSGGAGGDYAAGGLKDGQPKYPGRNLPNFKPKDMIPIPWMVAMALQADGWWLRQDIIWHKPNPMPESVTDRCTKAHEYIFLLSKSPRYYYDAEAIADPATHSDKTISLGKKSFSKGQASGMGILPSGNGAKETYVVASTRNKRSVWTVTTKPYKAAHFATFPADLIEPCILAGCPAGGIVLDPFGGSGTTGAVAIATGRNAVLIELNPEYLKLAEQRINSTQPPLLTIQNGLLEVEA